MNEAGSSQGSQVGMNTLKDLQEPPVFQHFSRCHSITHFLGHINDQFWVNFNDGLCKFNSIRTSRHCSKAISSTMLLVAVPRWIMLPCSSLMTPPKPSIPGFPLEAPSILIFKNPWGVGCEIYLREVSFLTPLTVQRETREWRPNYLRMWAF